MTDEPTPELRALAARLFAAGRAERPSAALGRRLLMIAPAGAAPPAPAPEAPAAIAGRLEQRPSEVSLWSWRARSRAWVGAAALAAASAGVWWSLGERRAVDISPDPVVARARPSQALPLAPPEAQGALPLAQGASRLGQGALPLAQGALPLAQGALPLAQGASRLGQGAVAAPGDREGPSAVEPPSRVPPAPRRRARPSAHVAPPAASSRAAPAPEVARPRQAAPGAVGPGSSPPEPRAVSAPPLSEELVLLKQARVALRSGDAARALEQLDRHDRARAADSMQAEATVLRIEALDALGRRTEASELARRFVRESPHSALGDRAKTFIRAAGSRP